MWTEILECNDSLVTRRKDPNYVQVTSHIPKDLAKRLKFYCTEKETTITELVETAIKEFLDKEGYPQLVRTEEDKDGKRSP